MESNKFSSSELLFIWVRYCKSAPAQKAFPFALSKIILTDLSAIAILNAAINSDTKSPLSAFLFSGRLSVIVASLVLTEYFIYW